jgi:hypothetical protein
MGEQDMLSITKAGYACEFEVKISKADFKNDFKKIGECYRTRQRRRGKWFYRKHKHLKHDVLSGKVKAKESWRKPKYFWFVVPEDLISQEDVPEYAGLMYYHVNDKGYSDIREIKRPVAQKNVKPLPQRIVEQVKNSMMSRFLQLWLKS